MAIHLPAPIRAIVLTTMLICSGVLSSRVHALPASRPVHVSSPLIVTVEDPDFNGQVNPWRSFAITDGLLFSSLFALDARGRLRPELLREIPSAANHEIDDRRHTVTLHLRPHLLWSSGVEITAADLRFGWRVLNDPAANGACSGSCDRIASISVPDRYTAVVRFKDLDPSALSDLPTALPHTWTLLGHTPHAAAKKLLQDPLFTFVGKTYAGHPYWTDGPYQAEKTIDSQCVLFQRMPLYRVHPLPALSTIKVCPLSESGADVVKPLGPITLSPSDLPVRAPTITAAPYLQLVHLEFNVGSAQYRDQVNPVSDVRVRQALALATDRTTLARTVLQGTAAQVRPLAAFSPLYAPRTAPGLLADPSLSGAWSPLSHRFLPYGPQALADARALLQAAGYGSGITVDLALWSRLPLFDAIAHELQRQWQAIGVQVAIRQLPTCWPCNNGIAEGKYEIVLLTSGLSFDPGVITRLALASGRNLSGFQNAQLDQAIDQGLRSMDWATRAPAYRRVERIVTKEAYWLPLLYPPVVVGVSRRLTGVSVNPAGSALWDVYRWRLRR